MSALTALTLQVTGVLIAVAVLGFLVGRASARPTAPGAAVAAEELLRAKEEEIGRLETGALAALERTVTTFRGQVEGLEQELVDVRARNRELDLRVAEESTRAGRLEAAIADRDAHLAALREELRNRS